MLIVSIGGEEIRVTGISVEDFSLPIPYVLCSQDGRIQGVDAETEAYLKVDHLVLVTLDEQDGRVFPANAHLFRGVLYCTPTPVTVAPKSTGGFLWPA